MKRTWDLIVVGAGPAGCTLATLVKKHDPARRVLLLEKSPGPRHHIGESLLPGIVPVLKEMGVFEKIDSAGFPRKLGATYIWGRDRTPWENDFNAVNVEPMIQRYGRIPETLEYAWQVRRSEYDEILLRHANECGVEVLRGALAKGVIEEDGRIVGLTMQQGEGPARRLRAEFVADCSGQNGFLSKHRRIREYNRSLKNVAGYAYFKGAKWKYEYTAHPDKTKIFVCSVDDGWFWYIPIERDVVSVGFVTTVDHLKRNGIADLRELFFREMKACGEIWPLLKDAELIADFEGTGKDFFTQSDWSYLNVAASGPGWLAAGDAAVFVDPILSSGVTLAHLAAHRAAYTLLMHWSEKYADMSELLWNDYDLYCREAAAQYLALALFWYGNDPCAEDWWGRARRLQRAWLPVDLTDKGAFITVSSGLTQYYDRVFSTLGLMEENLTRSEEYPFYTSIFKPSEHDGRAGVPLPDDCVPKLTAPRVVEFTFLPAHGEGRLRPVKRVRFLKHDPNNPLRDCFNPRKMVTRYHIAALEQIDGRRTLAQIRTGLRESGLPDWWIEGPLPTFLRDLGVQGVLEITPGRLPAARKGGKA